MSVPDAQFETTAAAPPVERASFLDVDGQAVFVRLHLPGDGPARAGAVVCPPIGADFLADYRREVNLARALAGAGIAVARVHYRGTGHSEGDPAGADLSSQVADVDAAAALLSAEAGTGPPALIGTRWGALVAASAAGAIGAPALVLIEPVTGASRFYREAFRAVSMKAMLDGQPSGQAQELAARLDTDGVVDILGFPLTTRLRDSAAAVALPDSLGEGSAVLLVRFGRSEAGPPPSGWPSGTTTAAVPDTEAWWFIDPGSTASPALIDAVTGFLDERIEGADLSTDVTAPAEATIAEQPVSIRSGGERLFGILHAARPAPSPTAVLLATGGGVPSPHRNGMWTRLARRIAAEQELDVFRFDWSGVGDSTGPEGFALNRPATGDVLAAVDWLAERGAARVLLVGTCFGGRSVLTAAGHAAVTGIMTVSVPMVDEQAEVVAAARSMRWVLRRAFTRDALRRLRDRERRRALMLFARRKGSAAIRRATGRPADSVSPLMRDALRTATARGLPVRMVYGDADTAYPTWRQAAAGPLGSLPGVEVIVRPGEWHAFAAAEVQQGTIDLAVEFVADHLG